MKLTALFAVALPLLIGAVAIFPYQNQPDTFHSEEELAQFRSHIAARSSLHAPPDLKIDSNILFPTGKVCGGCHGYDPNGRAFITSSGEDVNIYDDWRSTMMANAARDPFWRAKVTHEMLANPAHSTALQDKCTSCHAPSGHYQAKLHDKKPFYTLADLYTDTLGLDGVSCQTCHAQSPQDIGQLHSGELRFDTNYIRVAYGPYEQVFEPPMHQFVGITPKYGEHIGDAGLCAGCHTLVTKSVDETGQYTGSTFIEQATYHEWLNSNYDSDHHDFTCQGCHVLRIPDAVVISANYQFLTNKFPFGKHDLAGANVTMLKLMRDNREALGINAKAEHFDSTIAETLRMLQYRALDMELRTGSLAGDTAQFSVLLFNKAGHKFPSGYPARRVWVEMEVKDYNHQVLFHSGRMAADYSLPDEDPNFEPHYHIINRPEQVQIYELVPGDVKGQFTNILERAHIALKDNRLTPQGFLKSDPVYDTTRIVGHALTDPDFNFSPTGQEGSATDLIHYRIPKGGHQGYLRVTARVWYQSLPPKWIMPMFEWSSPEIETFKTMFEAADRKPVLVAEQVLDSVYIGPSATHQAGWEQAVRVTPTLTQDGQVVVSIPPHLRLQGVQVWDAAGRLVVAQSGPDLALPRRAGVYLVAVITDAGRVMRKVVLNP